MERHNSFYHKAHFEHHVKTFGKCDLAELVEEIVCVQNPAMSKGTFEEYSFEHSCYVDFSHKIASILTSNGLLVVFSDDLRLIQRIK